jgi:rare lipoprotein A (peptidoglycan hydrolase)
MRTIIKALAAALPLAIVLTTNVNAAPYWKCMGPAFACGTTSTASYKTTHYGKKAGNKGTSYSSKKQARRSRTAARKSGGGYSGMASWYGGGFHGRKTASGERFNMNALTAAHRSLPFGTRVLVTNTRNGRSVEVRINDRGPFVGGRVIDLSRAAASQIGLTASGVAPVRLAVLGRG